MDEAEESRVALSHIGIARRSGRYPWGSGKNPQQTSRNFKAYLDEMTSQGMTPSQIAEHISEYSGKKVSTTDLRANIAISTEHIFAENQSRAHQLTSPPSEGGRGMSTSAAARLMGTNESTVRGWLKTSTELKEGSLRATAEALKNELETKPYLDVGKGQHLYMGISFTKFNTSLAMLHDEGYEIHPVKVPQLGTDKKTTVKVLTKPGVPWKEARDAVERGELRTIAAQSDDGGQHFRTAPPKPTTVDLKRVAVRYAEDGGAKMDGVIELRRGVEDLSLGASKYAQIRMSVNDTHYLKGMAMYADDLPPGVDVRFNTNKTKADAPEKLDAMKPLKMKDGKLDTDDPFGSGRSTKARLYIDKDGKEKASPLNILNEEGKWDEWSRSLSSQMLSKQPVALAARQLGEARKKREDTLAEINALTNPVVKKKMLEDFAETADAAAVHLKAAALPRQSTHVILPMNSMRENEIYAPNFENGEKVVLVRHPHGGPFEIPALTVNNKNAAAKKIMGAAKDAVGIHYKVAEQLSGADFDGDTVIVIPNNDGRVKSKRPLAQLEGFDPKAAYPGYEGMQKMTKQNTQTEMGKISNLITDMTILKANDDEIARAVKHSMVVIDAEKHGLNYKKSEQDNNIAELKRTYQQGSNKGAATLISKASSEIRVPQRELRKARDGGPVDPKTGKLVYVPTGEQYPKTTTKVSKRTGEVTTKTTLEDRLTKTTKMDYADDARTLMSRNGEGTPMERIYADHANSMKGMANAARKEAVSIKDPLQSPAAKAVYANEFKSLQAKLQVAQRNAPLERRAQVLGNAIAKARIDSEPGMDKDHIKKIKYASLDEARNLTGANKKKIGSPDLPITHREWEAIQAGAMSSTMLREILTHSDMNRIKELATPRARTAMSPGQLTRARQMASQGKPMSEIVEALGLPRSTVVENLKDA